MSAAVVLAVAGGVEVPAWYSLLAQYQVEQDLGAMAATIRNHRELRQ